MARTPSSMIIIARIKTVRYFLRESPDTIMGCLRSSGFGSLCCQGSAGEAFMILLMERDLNDCGSGRRTIMTKTSVPDICEEYISEPNHKFSSTVSTYSGSFQLPVCKRTDRINLTNLLLLSPLSITCRTYELPDMSGSSIRFTPFFSWLNRGTREERFLKNRCSE